MVETRHLRHLVAVADHGSLRAAARALRRSPAALTKSLQRLERHLGTPLLDRRRRPARLTPAARKAVERARHGLGILASISTDLRAAGPEATGRVRVGVGPLVAETFLARVLSRALRVSPSLSVTVKLGYWSDCVEALKLGESDLFLGDVTTAQADPMLAARAFPPSEIVAFCRARHPILRERAISPSTFLSYPLAVATPPPWGVRWLQNLRRRARLPVPDACEVARLVCDGFRVLAAVVHSSDHLGFGPPALVEAEVRAGRAARVPFDTSDLRSNAGSVVVAGRALSPATAYLRDVAHAVAERVADEAR